MEPLPLLLDSARVSLPLLRYPAVARRWDEPSMLSEWTVGGLAGHFARSLFNLERALQNPPSPAAALLDVVDYYTVTEPQPADSALGRRIRELGDEEAAAGPGVLAGRFTDAISYLDQRSTQADLPPTVTLFSSPMSLSECATACLLELVVHADDLAVSVEAPMPDLDPAALDLVAASLARISVRRRGALSVLRAFTRPERASERIFVF